MKKILHCFYVPILSVSSIVRRGGQYQLVPYRRYREEVAARLRIRNRFRHWAWI